MPALSYRQKETLRRCAKEPIPAGNTNATLSSLERRGLVEGKRHPRLSLYCMWTITDAGLALLAGPGK
jgi:hypothetical protein